MKSRPLLIVIVLNLFTIFFVLAQDDSQDPRIDQALNIAIGQAPSNIPEHAPDVAIAQFPDTTLPPVVTVTAPAITARPTRKFSSPLPPCILGCLQKAVDSSGCGKNAADSSACACINPVYQVTSRSCIQYTCSESEQALASHLQQKCSENKEIRPGFRPLATIHQTASLTTNMMAVNTEKAKNTAPPKKGMMELEWVIGAAILGLVLVFR
ncbi:hypothetical protein D9756_011547 [Leucocoprinus leucothites]|uniref:CFEM domain-containing protein n=1 Tax=Leucocoprinus leucothites TaxID=201217 RepID=A0A8H5CLR1_9AGAR|nr:hypothetical protein D9756_011547 [Leucoagaricus leucothites]